MAAPTPRGLPQLAANQTYALVTDYNLLGVTTDAAITQAEAGAAAYADLADKAVVNEVNRVLGADSWKDVEKATIKNLWIDPRTTNVSNMNATNGTMSAPSFSTGPTYRVTADGAGLTRMSMGPRPPISTSVRKVWVTFRAFADTARTAAVSFQGLAGTTSTGTIVKDISVTGSWQTFTIPFDVPTGTDNFRVTLYASGSGTVTSAGATLTVDRLGVLTAEEAWFHGSTPNVDGTNVDGVEVDRTYSWDGTVDASQSTQVRTTTTVHLGDWVPGTTVASRIAAIEDQLAGGTGGGGGGPAPVEPPPGWAGLRTLTTPTVHQAGGGFMASVTADTLRAQYGPTGTPTWVSPSGGGSGSTRNSPTTLGAAIAAKKTHIRLLPGEYRNDTAAVGSTLTTHSYALVADAPGVLVTGHLPTPTWTARGDGAYTAPVVASAVMDPRPAHDTDPARGIHATYEQKASASDVTGPGQWYADATTTTVWPLGGTNLTTAPDTLRLSGKNRTGIYASAGTVYAEGIEFQGGWDTPYMHGGLLVALDCQFRYSAISNGLNVRNANIITVNCDASGNWLDGFNYHESGGGTANFIEINCTGHRNGQASKRGNCNGSTAHETVHGLRVGGHYGDTFGPVLADVNDAQTWTIGATTERTTATMSTLPHVHCDGSATSSDVACMWVQSHTATGLGTAWKATNGATVRLRSETARTTTLLDAATGTVTREWEATA